jgi:branched-chain amino acid transport system ATP-binding protein
MALLEIKGLNKSFGGIRAVEECTFSVEEGSIVSLIGPNGAGKTTVFNLVTGLLPLDSGNIYFDGRKINDLQPHQITHMGISRTFQITRDLQELTVLENMIVQSKVKGFWDMFGTSMLKEEENRAMDLLSFVGIDYLANEKSKNLSYGQKKLLEFASVLMSDPRMIMLDEPAGGVNPTLLESIIDRILQLNKKGITFLIVEHNMELVMKISNPVICMAYGTVLAQGSPKEIQEDKRVLEAYLGE